jgi:hypothetical protein
MTGDRDDDEREVLDNPEWSEDDIRKGTRLRDFAPALADTLRRAASGQRVTARAGSPPGDEHAATRAKRPRRARER